MIGGFAHHIEDWIIAGGFRNIEDLPGFAPFLPRDINNAILISKDDSDEYCLTGPGAGPAATASAMIQDALELMQDFDLASKAKARAEKEIG